MTPDAFGSAFAPWLAHVKSSEACVCPLPTMASLLFHASFFGAHVDRVIASYGMVSCRQTLSVIFKSGFSRIPVFAKDHNDVIGLLFTKDLIFIDPDDETPLKNFVQIFGRAVTVRVLWIQVYSDCCFLPP